MPICITCTTPLPHLYTTYSKADDRTLGKGVRLTQCPNCKRFADKYVEHDYIVLFIDLVLIKPQVYRHLLFNRLGASEPHNNNASANSNSSEKSSSGKPKGSRMDPSILRLGILLVLFDVYITWARIERANSHPSGSAGDGAKEHAHRLNTAPILVQYLFFLTLNVASTLAQHLTIRTLASWMLSWRERRAERAQSTHELTSPPLGHTQTQHDKPSFPRPFRASPSAVSTALLVSSCTKLFPILLVIWPPATSDGSETVTVGPFASRASSYISWVVLFNNIEALLILLNCGYVATTGLAVSGMLARYVVEGWLLGMAGLERDASSGPVGDLVEVGGWLRTFWGSG